MFVTTECRSFVENAKFLCGKRTHKNTSEYERTFSRRETGGRGGALSFSRKIMHVRFVVSLSRSAKPHNTNTPKYPDLSNEILGH